MDCSWRMFLVSMHVLSFRLLYYTTDSNWHRLEVIYIYYVQLAIGVCVLCVCIWPCSLLLNWVKQTGYQRLKRHIQYCDRTCLIVSRMIIQAMLHYMTCSIYFWFFTAIYEHAGLMYSITFTILLGNMHHAVMKVVFFGETFKETDSDSLLQEHTL